MYHRRDFIITIISIFLALGIGILVGTALSDNIIVQQQKEVVEQLEKELIRYNSRQTILKEDKKALEDELSMWAVFQDDILPELIISHLKDKNIALIYSNCEIKNLDVWNLLESAGADKFRIYGNAQGDTPGNIKIQEEAFDLNSKSEKELFYDYIIQSMGYYDQIVVFSEDIINSNLKELLLSKFKKANLDIISVYSSSLEEWETYDYLESGIKTADKIETVSGQLNLLQLLGK